jgi:DNA-directed RNA polymerase specialized sigma24 family protein
METSSRDGGIDRRVMDNIRFNARRLARGQTVPGMAVEDYEQDLVLDLLHRRRAFNPRLASFATFADRIVGHRASTLASPTLRRREERRAISLDAPVMDEDGVEVTLLDLLPDEVPRIDEAAAIRIDVARFVAQLPPLLRDLCAILPSDGAAEAAKILGVHRSTAYDRIARLREEAAARGLAIYVGRGADSSDPPRVCGGYGHGQTEPGAGSEPMPMALQRTIPRRTSLLIDETELRLWLATAEGGTTLEYHRGVLAVDRLVHGSRLSEPDRQQLERVADTLFSLATAGRGYLVQRRHGDGDYSYLFVVGAKGLRSESLRSTGES